MRGERLAVSLALTAAEIIDRIEHLLLRIGLPWVGRNARVGLRTRPPGRPATAPGSAAGVQLEILEWCDVRGPTEVEDGQRPGRGFRPLLPR